MRAVFLSILLLGLGVVAGCGGGAATGAASTTPSGGSGSGSNVLSISVNGGPAANQGSIYQNAAFASVTICVPEIARNVSPSMTCSSTPVRRVCAFFNPRSPL